MNNDLKHKTINFMHLKKLLTCQPYFVWHDLESSEVSFQIEDDKSLIFELPSFINDTQTINFSSEYEHALSAIQNYSISYINKKFLDFVKLQFLNLKIVPYASAITQVKVTNDFLTKMDDQVIYNPVFIYDFKGFQVKSNPQIYDAKTGSVYFLKMSLNTKRSDIIKLYFDVEVMRKLGYKINRVYLYILATKKYLKGEIDFYLTKTLSFQKNGNTFKDKSIFNYYEIAQLSKVGLNSKTHIDILQTIDSKSLLNEFHFQDLDVYLEMILYATDYDVLEPLSELDHQFLADCHIPWKSVLNLTADANIQNFSGYLIKKTDVIKQHDLFDLKHEKPLLKLILDNANKVIINELKTSKILKDINLKLVVWYDFEAFSLPIAPLDNFLPFSQVVSQVSIIKTKALKETFNYNYVLDPLTIKLIDLIKIIDLIYDVNADYYIVYNQTYEHSRLKEIILKMKEAKIANVTEYEQKVQEIIHKTIDLVDLFKITSYKIQPPVLITSLKGMFSIKKLEDYITTHYPKFAKQIKPYKSLKISNGLLAMETANQRALGIIGDNEWNRKVKQLAQYCENDVRAMIMVYEFVNSFLNQK